MQEFLTYLSGCELQAYQYVLLLCLVVRLFSKDVSALGGLMSVYVGYVVLIVMLISPLVIYRFQNNIYLTNVHAHLSLLLYYLFYVSFIVKSRFHVSVCLLILLMVLFSFFVFDWGQDVVWTYTVGLSYLVVVVVSFFNTYLTSQQLHQKSVAIRCCVGMGILLFFVCSFPILVYIEELVVYGALGKAYFQLLSIGNFFLALGFLAGSMMLWKNN